MWYETVIEKLTGPQLINDSKTPSGRVHVGSLRGIEERHRVLSINHEVIVLTFISGVKKSEQRAGNVCGTKQLSRN